MKLWDYPDPVENWDLTINRYATQKVEFGGQGVAEKVAEIEALLKQKIAELDALPNDPELEKAEPNDLEAIRSLRPAGSRRMTTALADDFRDRLEGAWKAPGWRAAPAARSAPSSKAGRSTGWSAGLLISATPSPWSIIGAKRNSRICPA